ncbi:hypothetical protein JCM10213_005030 [Rhodosporidiobolus nylandii]
MPLWSRSIPTPSTSASPSSSTAPLPSASTSPPAPPPPPGFLANHHRKSSSNLSQTYTNHSSTRRGKGAKKERSVVEADELAGDDETWDEGSDDEERVAQLAGRLSGLKVNVQGASTSNLNSGGAGGAGSGAPSGASPSTASSWFGFSSASAARTPGPKRQASGSSLAPAEAVAAALGGKPPLSSAGSSASLAAPTPGLGTGLARGTSYLAAASGVQSEADKQVREEERRKSLAAGEGEGGEDEGEPAQEPEEKGETEEGEAGKKESRREEMGKKLVRADVEELVKDPTHVLARLRTAWAPPSPPSPSRRRASVASVPDPSPNPNAASFPSGEGGADEDDDDPALGYVQLDAPSLSSTDPTLFDWSAPPPNPEEEGERGRENRRKRKFLEVLGAESVDLAELRKLAWNGVPGELRTMVWQLLLGYLPLPLSRRSSTLARKRSEYASLVKHAFSRGVSGLDSAIWHQISIDVPRTRPGVLLWAAEATQRSLERVLYVWAIRHPASGYVQGINDLVCPFFEVFLEGYIDGHPSTFDLAHLPPCALEALEADSFWCLSKLLDGIQDNYIFAQPGIQRLVKKMEGLCQRVDAPLSAHLKDQGVEFIQFAFRWMNCLLMRELSVKNIVRMWDTYLAEGGDAFSEFHLYVCLAFLVRWSDKLREMDFQSIIIFLQSLPTQDWTDKNTELLLSEAFLWSRTFQAR